ncbi:MAG: hypothetical protein KAH32_08900 [Chlamydiia bacterium]|nr:hypothetical protein [Chlamydiia bacterium]
MKNLIFSILLFTTLHSFAQDETGKFDFKFGVGSTFLGSGDIVTISFRNELNYRINNYFSSSVKLGYGKGDNCGIQSYVSGDIDVFISPFRNNRNGDFRIGVGLSYIHMTENKCYNQEPSLFYDIVDKKGGLGANLIIDYSYAIKGKYIVGLMLQAQHSESINVTNSGAFLTFGIRI